MIGIGRRPLDYGPTSHSPKDKNPRSALAAHFLNPL